MSLNKNDVKLSKLLPHLSLVMVKFCIQIKIILKLNNFGYLPNFYRQINKFMVSRDGLSNTFNFWSTNNG